jgi:hypothetical protein
MRRDFSREASTRLRAVSSAPCACARNATLSAALFSTLLSMVTST